MTAARSAFAPFSHLGTLGRVTPEKILAIMLLFGGTTPSSEQRHVEHPPPADGQNALESVDRLTKQFGETLLAAPNVPDLLERLARVVADSAFPQAVAQLGNALVQLRASTPVDFVRVREGIERELPRLPIELRSTVRHGMAVNAEIIRRLPLLLSEWEVPSVEQLTESVSTATRSDDPVARRVIEASACGFAIARMLFYDSGPKVDHEVASEIVRRWFTSNREVLALLDPIQHAIDDTIATLPESTRRSLLRLTYEWRGDDSDPALIVWLVMRDSWTEKEAGLDEMASRMSDNLFAVTNIDAPVFLRLRLASEPA